MRSSPTMPTAMLPPTMKATPPNILRSVSPTPRRKRLADAVGKRLVIGHRAKLASTATASPNLIR